MPEERLQAECRSQLGRLFGARSAAPIVEFYKDWAADRYTATVADENSTTDHITAPTAAPSDGPWVGQIWAIGSEWATEFPGYIAGAVESAKMGVKALSCNVDG